MFNFEEITKRIANKLNSEDRPRDLANIFSTSSQNINNWKNRNKIPYEEIVTICVNNNIDINEIFTGEETEKNCPEIDFKSEIHNMIDNLDDKKAEVYYHLIKAEILKEKL